MMATDIYVRIENKDGEVLTADACSPESIGAFQKVDHDDEAFVLAFEQNVTLPTDDRTGQVTGSPRHKYLKIKKFVDKCSPLLAGQLVNPSELEVNLIFTGKANLALNIFIQLFLKALTL
jgi:type VI secretion system secreted protein Hcp